MNEEETWVAQLTPCSGVSETDKRGPVKCWTIVRFDSPHACTMIAQTPGRIGHLVQADAVHARKLAAAPELLEACKFMVAVCEGYPDVEAYPAIKECIEAAKRKIAKAEGFVM